jgi:hypothetical protein
MKQTIGGGRHYDRGPGQIFGRPLALKGFQGVCLVPFLIPSAVVFLKILKVLGSRNLLLVLHLRVLWWWFMGCMVVVYGMYGGGLWDVWWWFMGCGENLQGD